MPPTSSAKRVIFLYYSLAHSQAGCQRKQTQTGIKTTISRATPIQAIEIKEKQTKTKLHLIKRGLRNRNPKTRTENMKTAMNASNSTKPKGSRRLK